MVNMHRKKRIRNGEQEYEMVNRNMKWSTCNMKRCIWKRWIWNGEQARRNFLNIK